MSNTIIIPQTLIVSTIETLTSNANILVDRIEKFERDSGLTVAQKQLVEDLITKLDTFGFPEGASEDEVDYTTAKDHEDLLKEVTSAFNLLRNQIAKQKRTTAEKYKVVEAYETIQKLEAVLNEKNTDGNYIRPRDENTSPFRVHLDLVFNGVPHKDGSGRMFTHDPQRHTFTKRSGAEVAAKSNPFNVKSATITDEWEEATKAWKICRNANSNIVTPEMQEILLQTIVVSTLDAGYKLYKSKRGNKTIKTSTKEVA